MIQTETKLTNGRIMSSMVFSLELCARPRELYSLVRHMLRGRPVLIYSRRQGYQSFENPGDANLPHRLLSELIRERRRTIEQSVRPMLFAGASDVINGVDIRFTDNEVKQLLVS